MGHKVLETPRLDKLASESVVFTQGHVAAPLCGPSLAAIMTGLAPHQNKILGNEPPPGDGKNRDRFYRQIEKWPTLVKCFGERGGSSLQTGKWWHGDFHGAGFTHGMTLKGRHGDEGLAIGRKTMQPIYDFVATAKKESKPFFVWYAPMMPHSPHTPPAELLKKYEGKGLNPKDAAYAGMVEWFDQTCGQLLDHLEKEGLHENTIVAYVADNGWKQGAIAPHHDGKRSPYEGGIRTPILLRWPGRMKPGRVDTPAMSTDLAPTFLAAWGMKPTPQMQGANLVDLAGGRVTRKVVCGAAYEHNMADWDDPLKSLQYRWAIGEGRWKAIAPRPGGAGKPELYDLSADPHEQTDLAAKMPDKVADLLREIEAWWVA
jgi:uncharacterized sulfatase